MNLCRNHIILISKMKRFFNSAKGLNNNHFGVIDREQGASLACIKCGIVQHNFKDFAEYGPCMYQSRYFCDDHKKEWNSLMIEAMRLKFNQKDNYGLQRLYSLDRELVEMLDKEIDIHSFEDKQKYKTSRGWIFLQ